MPQQDGRHPLRSAQARLRPWHHQQWCLQLTHSGQHLAEFGDTGLVYM